MQEYWSVLPFPSPVDRILSNLSTMTRPSWVAPRAWLGFIELDKVVVLVWLGWLVFCEYGFSVSALWCPLVAPTILLGFLLPWAWGDWFQIRKGTHQSYILLPWLFNLYAEYIMRNARLDEAQTGIKIGGRNINNLRRQQPSVRKWRRTVEPLDESERGEWKIWLKNLE